MVNLLSKKDLLKFTGISYGQLYRWKRENLIPEEWFIKKSSFTGQETYFPEDKILKRIEIIQKLKDSYSLEELAHFLSPELTDRLFQSTDIQDFNGLDPEVITFFAESKSGQPFSYVEVVLIYAVSILKKETDLYSQALEMVVRSVCSYSSKIKGTNCYLIIFTLDNSEGYYSLTCQYQAQLNLDTRFKEVRSFYLEELSNDLKLKLDRGLI